jgi:hypothetical protein
MRVPLRERTFGELIGLCFSVAAGNFRQLFLLSLVLNVPGTFLGTLLEDLRAGPSAQGMLLTLVSALIAVLTGVLLQAATIRVVAGSFTGEAASLGDCLRLALRKMWPLLGYGMTVGVIINIGFLLCIAPGVIFMGWYYLGPPALVVEDLGVGRAMERSKKMGAGRRGEVLGFLLITSLLFQGLIVALSFAFGALVDPALAPWVNLPFASLLYMPLAVAPIVYYFNLRVAREGFDLERLSSLIERIGEEKAATPAG